MTEPARSRPGPPPTATRSTSPSGRRRGRRGAGWSSSTASRATAAGITASGRTLAEAGYEAHFPDRRGSGANRHDRGHTPSTGRLIDDVAEHLASPPRGRPATPIALAGISWGGKLAVVTAAERPDLVDALALICPGLHPRVGRLRRRAAADRPGLLHRTAARRSRSP